MRSSPTPFTIPVDEDALVDLRRRIVATRWPDQLDDTTWEHGADLDVIRKLSRLWADEFDWVHQATLLDRDLPGRRMVVDDLAVHYAHLGSASPQAMPAVVLLHGWPSSFAEMRAVADLLAKRDFEVIVPSLPGHGYSSIPRTAGYGADACATTLATLLATVLDGRPYVVHGGDRGAFVATSMGSLAPPGLVGIHVSLPGGIPGTGADRTAEEDQWLADTAAWVAVEGGYSAIQSTRPQTLAYGLHDSPVGMLAWIVEKFRAWSDCGGDVFSVFSDIDLLVNATIYWTTGTMRSSAHWYWEHRVNPPTSMTPVRVEVPTAVIRYPLEVMRAPRSAVQRKYNLVRWTDKRTGGHFPAHEDAEGLSADIAEFARGL